MFSIGMKVVCVNDKPPFDWRERDRGEKLPVEGCVYTVRWIDLYGDGILLVEIVNQARHYGLDLRELCFMSWRFRPLTDQKKSVSFTAGAPDDSERWDNRRKVVEPAAALRSLAAQRGQG